MIDVNEIKNGQHCWAIHCDQLMVVLKTDGRFEVCGDWECGVSASDIKIIEVIEKPHTEKDTELYYDYSY